jgi:hypothetical protein
MKNQERNMPTKRVFIILLCALFFAGFFLTPASHSQSLEEIRAKARAEVRREMGLDEPVRPDMRQEGISGTKEKGMPVRSKTDILIQAAFILMVLAIIPATIAKVKGRSFIAWWVLGLLCFIVVFPISIYMKKLPEAGRQEPIQG